MNGRYLLFASVAAILIAVLRTLFYDAIGTKIDATFLVLVLFAFLIPIIPWERISTFKAAGIELVLEQPQVQSAIEGLGLDRVADKQLRDNLSRLGDDLTLVRRSRILWIDDHPHLLVGERRLFRALGAEVLTAISTQDAETLLESDNDIDLIISDVQRAGESYQQVAGGVEIHEGVNFVVKLRQYSDTVIKALPVLFYAAYDWERLVQFTQPARELLPEIEISNTSEMLFVKAIRMLSNTRLNPIVVQNSKTPTGLRIDNKAN